MNKPVKKAPLSLERGARAVFIKGFQASQFLGRVSHVVSSAGRVLLNPRLHALKVKAWWNRMSLHWRRYWFPRWSRLQKMKTRDYWVWLGWKRRSVRDWCEQRWMRVAIRFAKGSRKAELQQKIAEGEVQRQVKTTPRWASKAHSKAVLKEKNRIR
jgi:hypothetical protein